MDQEDYSKAILKLKGESIFCPLCDEVLSNNFSEERKAITRKYYYNCYDCHQFAYHRLFEPAQEYFYYIMREHNIYITFALNEKKAYIYQLIQARAKNLKFEIEGLPSLEEILEKNEIYELFT